MRKSDLRISRSIYSIKGAFIELLKEKGYENIRIIDIAERAFINRKTFYAHYQSKQALYEDILGEIAEDLCQSFVYIKQNIDQASQAIVLKKDIRKFLQMVNKHKEILTLIWTDDEGHDISHHLLYWQMRHYIMNHTEELLLRTDKNNKDDIPYMFFVEFIINCLTTWGRWWINSENTSLNDGVDFIYRMMNKKVINILKYNAKSTHNKRIPDNG